VLNLISRSSGRRAQPSAAERYQNTVQELKKYKLASDLTKQISRRWKAGDVYAPHDLSPVEMQKWKQRGRPERDVVDVLKLDVLGEYKVGILFLYFSSFRHPVPFFFT
jgi:small subunit ribosomal protein S18